MRREADRTYINLMIMRTLATARGRVSIQQIYEAIEPKMDISIRSVQRYMNRLEFWGLVDCDGAHPKGFSLTLHAEEFIKDMAKGVAA
ncbi:MAG: hypothetical protein ACRC4N_01220 [Gammaproteobacteria bacterium]